MLLWDPHSSFLTLFVVCTKYIFFIEGKSKSMCTYFNFSILIKQIEASFTGESDSTTDFGNKISSLYTKNKQIFVSKVSRHYYHLNRYLKMIIVKCQPKFDNDFQIKSYKLFKDPQRTEIS